MYRLVLYILIALVCVASFLSYFSLVPSTPTFIIVSALVLVAVGRIANSLFSWAFDAPTNFESVYITALILALIMTPAKSFSDLVVLSWAVTLAMLSKYVLSINRKHIFNPLQLVLSLQVWFLDSQQAGGLGRRGWHHLLPFLDFL